MSNTKKMVTAMFRDHAHAQEAYQGLLDRGYVADEINVLMSDTTRAKYYAEDKEGTLHARTEAAEGVGIGGAIGTAVGAALAAVMAVGTSLVVPGLGLVIAGPLAAAFAGGGAGAVAGGVIGGLVGLGIPEPNAQAYLDALRDGGVVLGVTPHSSKDAKDIEDLFGALHGENICYC
jgi:hypothetical protein